MMLAPRTLLLALGALVLGAAPALAYPYDETYTFNPNATIPDGNLNGLSLSQTLVSQILSISSVEVTLNISGGFNGDYYAYLVHSTPNGTGFSILLNRVGSTAGNSYGYADSGMNVTLVGSALNNIHTYQTVTNPGGGALTMSTWQEDGRSADPFSVMDTSPRNALLSSFNGLDANGTWTLYIADVASLGQGSLVSWGLHVQGVPEPGTWAGGIGALALAMAAWRKRAGSRRARSPG